MITDDWLVGVFLHLCWTRPTRVEPPHDGKRRTAARHAPEHDVRR